MLECARILRSAGETAAHGPRRPLASTTRRTRRDALSPSAFGAPPTTRYTSMMRHRVFAVLLALAAVAPPLLAQQKTVTGRVTAEGGMPVPDVTVYIRGTN